MRKQMLVSMAVAFLALQSHAALAEEEPETWFEIFRLAPGRHEQFVRDLAKADEVSKAGGQPPLKLFFHEHGGEWDVLIMKRVGESNPTPEQQAAMDAKSKELGIPSGPAYYIAIRENIASHTDTKTIGPISAADWLAKLDQWRAENAKDDKTDKKAKKQ